MSDNLKEFIKGAKWIALAFVAIVVSMGDIYASIGYSQLHRLDPVKYNTQDIYWVFGIINLILVFLFIRRGVKKENDTK